MATLKPFRGFRPPPDLVQRIAAPPYDVVSTDEARAYARGNESSFFHISRPEIELPGVDEHDGEVYERGVINLRAFIARGWLQRDEHPSFYLYRQRQSGHQQLGLVAVASVAEYEQGVIRKHELTRPEKEDDRVRHLEALNAHDEPVFLTYRSSAALSTLMAEASAAAPVYDFVTEDGVGHTFWVVAPAIGRKLEEGFAALPALYIADGHHRSAAAARVHAHFRSQDRKGGHDHFLAVAFPHDQLRILDYNRVVADLNGLTPDRFLHAVSGRFSVEPAREPKPSRPHTFGMYLDGEWYKLTAREEHVPRAGPEALDASILQSALLGPVLGIGDPRKDRRIDFIGGARGTLPLEQRVDGGDAQVAFTLFPPTVEQLMEIADLGGLMPPKSTWFEPKLRSGLVVHPFD